MTGHRAPAGGPVQVTLLYVECVHQRTDNRRISNTGTLVNLTPHDIVTAPSVHPIENYILRVPMRIYLLYLSMQGSSWEWFDVTPSRKRLLP